MTRSIQFVYPRDTKTVSLSGGGCALDCSHCNKHYIEQMDTLDSPVPENTKSFLISGGLDKDGKSFILNQKKKLLNIKKSGNYRFNSHVGFVEEEELDAMAQVVDYVSFDFVSDSDVIKTVYKLEKDVDEYIELYKRLTHKVKVYPHITIGLDRGKIHWEYEAIDILKELGADRLVLNVLIPTPGTEFADVEAPDLDEVRKVFKYAREVFKDEILIVGCMRPIGRYRADMDVMAIEEGVDRIVKPTPKARKLAETNGFQISYFYECCALDALKEIPTEELAEGTKETLDRVAASSCSSAKPEEKEIAKLESTGCCSTAPQNTSEEASTGCCSKPTTNEMKEEVGCCGSREKTGVCCNDHDKVMAAHEEKVKAQPPCSTEKPALQPEREDKAKLSTRMRLSTGSAAVLGLKDIKTRSKTKTIYLMNSGGCEYDCSFCSQAKSATSKQDKLSRVTWPEYKTDDVMDALEDKQNDYKRVCMQVVNTKNVFDKLPQTVADIRVKAPKTKIAMTVRTYKMTDVDAMFAAGADEVGLSIDAIDPVQFRKIKGGNFEFHKKFVLDAADKYPGKIATHLIVGMGETEKQVVELMEELNDHKVIIALFAFTPVRGSKMEFTKPPSLSSYRRIQVALNMIKNNRERNFTYNDKGEILEFGQPKEVLLETLRDSGVFETSGCSDCNRPYYNESARATDLYNYPDQVEVDKFKQIFDTIFLYDNEQVYERPACHV